MATPDTATVTQQSIYSAYPSTATVTQSGEFDSATILQVNVYATRASV